MRFRDLRKRGGLLRARRLSFEALERRDLLAVMRVVDWNTLNGPNNPTDVANFQTIFAAIGNETVQGNTQRIDILALQETDPASPGNDSIGQIASILNSLYPAANYEFFVSSTDGGGDSTGFVYDTTTVSLLNSVEVGAGTLTHKVSRGEFRPAGSLGESDFYVYSVHLKSGTAGADATLRGSEAALLRADADALGEGANVLIVGDFNMQGSFEAAYTTLVASGAGQVQDVADAPGSWNNNPAFKNLHSQDPQSTMDDRFDIQFASGEFFDGVGLEYVGNSYHVFGNNGTHTLDMPITTGTGASGAVLTALFAASDHLPVVADYQIIVSTPNVRITETLAGTKVIEGGLYDTYHVVLDTVPAANVAVTVTPNAQVDVGNGAGVAKVFTFTPANALTPQTVVVNAANDAVGEGDHTGLITHTSASSDAAYNALTITNVSVAIVDNDAPKIVINEIDSDTPTLPVNDSLEFVELYDGGVGNILLDGYIVVFFNGNAANDGSYAAFDLTGKSTNAEGFFVLGNSGVVPTPGLMFSNNTLQNGADAVALYFGVLVSAFPNGTAPTTSNLRDAIVYNTSNTVDTGLVAALTPGQPQVNENQNGSGTIESLSRVPDGGPPLQTTTYRAQTPTPGTFNASYLYGAEILQSGSRIDVQENGATDSYQIALQSIPTANVSVTVDPDNQTDLGAGAGVAIALTFTPANALIPQLITVTAVDDLAIEGVHTSTITHTAASADSQYNGVVISNVIANVVDNDVATPPSIVITELMYSPNSDEDSPGVGEWIEVVNAGASAVDLGGWLFDDEDATNWGAIPAGTILNSNQIAVFFDSDFTTAATFRADWNVPSGALVVGISWGNLANSPSPTNEILQLFNTVSEAMDVVNFDDTNPWPSAADGPSIYLKSLSLDNNSGANWARSVLGVGGAVSPTGSVFAASDIGSPGRFFLPGDYNLSGVVDAADYIVWRDTLGSNSDLRADGSGPSTGVPNGVVDQFDYTFWRANFGAAGVPNSGSGAGASQLVAAASFAQSTAVAPSVPTSVASNQSLAVDAAVADFGFAPSATNAAAKSRPALRRTSLQFASHSVDPLLALVRSNGRQRDGDDPLARHNRDSSAADHCDEVDELFAEFAIGGFAHVGQAVPDIRFASGTA
jgi:endonuclease/exonuclease/phosphatase family metal-dependent hydrolase